MKSLNTKPTYRKLLADIGLTIESARANAVKAINTELVKSNWEIGRHIVEFEQHGQERAEYGSELLARLSKDLSHRYGKGFGRRNILDMRRFYLAYSKWQTVSAKLSWSHYISLISISDFTARKFYERQSINENLSVRELERQIDSSLFERLALSKDKKGVLQLSEKGYVVSHPTEVVKDIEHKRKIIKGFTEKHNVDKLVWYEQTNDIRLAIQRAKQIKKWLRRWKLELIEKENPNWKDLFFEIGGTDEMLRPDFPVCDYNYE